MPIGPLAYPSRWRHKISGVPDSLRAKNGGRGAHIQQSCSRRRTERGGRMLQG
jgi:hypothetical protein